MRTTWVCAPIALVTPHALYWALGNTPFAREAAYAELVQAGISVERSKCS